MTGSKAEEEKVVGRPRPKPFRLSYSERWGWLHGEQDLGI